MTDLEPPPTHSGCLTEEEVREVREAGPGEVPDRLARHLVSCVRCQERALFGPEPRRRRRRSGSPALPTPVRALILLGVMIAVMALFFYTLNQFVGDPYR
jgi:hypothetical protein